MNCSAPIYSQRSVVVAAHFPLLLVTSCWVPALIILSFRPDDRALALIRQLQGWVATVLKGTHRT